LRLPLTPTLSSWRSHAPHGRQRGEGAEQQTAQALAAHHKAEIEKWWPIIKSANIKVETGKGK
jgi:hypothetical protein